MVSWPDYYSVSNGVYREWHCARVRNLKCPMCQYLCTPRSLYPVCSTLHLTGSWTCGLHAPACALMTVSHVDVCPFNAHRCVGTSILRDNYLLA